MNRRAFLGALVATPFIAQAELKAVTAATVDEFTTEYSTQVAVAIYRTKEQCAANVLNMAFNNESPQRRLAEIRKRQSVTIPGYLFLSDT